MTRTEATLPAQPEAIVPNGQSAFLLRAVAGVTTAAASGLLATLAFPTYGIWPLIFVAFIPMVIAQHRILPASISPLAPGVGIAVYYAGQLSAGLAEGNVAWYIQLWPVYVGLLVAGLCWPGRNFHSRTKYRWLALSFPLAWTAIDAARMLTGAEVLAGTWANPVYALYEQYQILQPLSIFGIFGLEMLVLVINFALAGVAIALIDIAFAPKTQAASLRHASIVAAAVAAVCIAWTVLSLALLDERPADLRVAAVQANSPLDPEEELTRMIQATRDLAADGAQIVVWREGGVKFDPLRERTGEFQALARETGTHIALGYGLREENAPRRNEAVVFAPDGEIFGPYGKSHPGRFAGDHSDTGGEYLVYDTALGRIATIICYDLDFTDAAREMARRGAQFIAVPSNDVPAIAATHYTHLVFRAIENRLPMAKADSMFDIAIIDPYGRILDRQVNAISVDEASAVAVSRSMPIQTVIADVPRGGGGSFYVRWGDWFGWLAIGALGLFTLWHGGAGLLLRRNHQ